MCVFASEIELLGHCINQDGRKPNTKGIEVITAMKSPTNVTKLKQFLGLCAYFRDYVPDTSDNTFLLRQLLKKDTPGNWTPDYEQSFENLRYLITAPSVILHHPHWDSRFEVYVDASKYGFGAMLANEIFLTGLQCC